MHLNLWTIGGALIGSLFWTAVQVLGSSHLQLKDCLANLQSLTGTLDERRQEADRRVQQFLIAHERIPRGTADWKLLKINRSQWNGTGQYAVGGSHEPHRFHPTARAAWERQLQLLEENKALEPRKRKTIYRLIENEILGEQNIDQQREHIDDLVLNYFIEDGDVFAPYTGIWGYYGLNYHQWVGVGHYQEGAKYVNRRIHPNALAAWTTLEKNLLARPLEGRLTESLRAKLLGSIREHIKNNSPAEVKPEKPAKPPALSLEEQAAQANDKLIRWIKKHKRLFTFDEMQTDPELKINSGQWAGTGLYRYKMGERSSRAFHRHISKAYEAILKGVEGLEVEQDPSGFTQEIKDELLRELRLKIQWLKMNRREKVAFASQTIASFYWTNFRKPRKEEFNLFQFTYNQWAATGVYHPRVGVSARWRFNDSSLDGLNKVKAILETGALPEGKTEADRAMLLTIINADIERASLRSTQGQ